MSLVLRPLVTLALVCAFAVPAFVGAHASGASFEEQVGAYMIDIGYDPISPTGGDRLVFDFGTFTKNGAPADFDHVWVRIEYESRTILATGIARADFGPTSLLFGLPSDAEGEVRVHARYQKVDETFVEVEFPISVLRSKESERESQRRLLTGGLLTILGAAVSFGVVRYWYGKS